MVRAVAERTLARTGYTVTTASDGCEGLEEIEAGGGFDLIVSDVVMPGMDGPAMVRKVRERLPDMPVLLMSGYAEEQLRGEIGNDGVAFLPKPFTVQQICDIVGGRSVRTARPSGHSRQNRSIIPFKCYRQAVGVAVRNLQEYVVAIADVELGTNPMTDNPVIQSPTWLGDIRHFFDAGDVGCMKPRGIDLSNYSDVKSHAFNIYMQVQNGNMPMGGTRWSANKVQSLLNWIQQKFPYGSDTERGVAAFAAAAAPARLRKNVAELSPAEWAKVKAAFTGLMALGPDDPNSYYAQAAVHGVPLLYCMHHVQPFASWHRVYLKLFEDALRTVSGCEDVTLPYWDVTQKAPDVLFEPPFDSYTVPVALPDPYGAGYVTERYPAQEIYDNYQQTPALAWSIDQSVLQPNFGQTSAHGFDSYYVQAHDNGHDRAGPTLQDPNIASFDPIFFFFHCNWDRVWLSWQQQANALDPASFTATLDKDDNPIWLQFPLAPWTETSIDTISMPEIGYDRYVEAQDVARVKSGNIGAEASFALADQKVSIRVKGIDRHNIPGTFAVLLQADGETLARQAFFQPPVSKDCPTCSSQRLVDIDFQIDQAALAGRTLSIAIDVPSLGKGEMGRFPLSQAGNPTINARFLLEER